MRILKSDFFSRIIKDDNGKIKIQRRSQFDFDEYIDEPTLKIVGDYINELLSELVTIQNYLAIKNEYQEYNCKCDQTEGICTHRR